MESLSAITNLIENREEVNLTEVLNVSCEECRRRKIKCDSSKPSCSFCGKRNKRCKYVLNKKKQVLSTQLVLNSVEKFESRITELENFLKQHPNLNPGGGGTGSDDRDEELTVKFGELGAKATDFNYSKFVTPTDANQLYSPCQLVQTICVQLMHSVVKNGNNQGWLNHHKSLLLSLCNRSPVVANSLCALTLSCTEAEDPHNRNLNGQVVDIFLNNCKAMLTQSYSVASVELIQALLMLSVVMYSRGDGLKCAMYVNSAVKYTHMLNLANLDRNSSLSLSSEQLAVHRKIYWEVFFCDGCTSFMCDRDPEILHAGTTFLVDSNGNSLNISLGQLDFDFIRNLANDSDFTIRVVPTLRVKLIELLKLAYYYTRKLNQSFNPELESQRDQLKTQLSNLAYLTAPNPLQPQPNLDFSNRYFSQDIQASLIIYFNATFIILNCTNLFTNAHIQLAEADLNFPSANYILKCVQICRANPSGRWLPALPYFVYLCTLFYYKAYQVYSTCSSYKANMAKQEFDLAYDLLDQFVLVCPIANYYLQIIIPVRRNLNFMYNKNSRPQINFLNPHTISPSTSHISNFENSDTFSNSSPTTENFNLNAQFNLANYSSNFHLYNN